MKYWRKNLKSDNDHWNNRDILSYRQRRREATQDDLVKNEKIIDD